MFILHMIVLELLNDSQQEVRDMSTWFALLIECVRAAVENVSIDNS